MEPRYKPLGTLKRAHKRDSSDTGKGSAGAAVPEMKVWDEAEVPKAMALTIVCVQSNIGKEKYKLNALGF